jgi:hypothetical protein
MRFSCHAIAVILLGSSIASSGEWTDGTNTWHIDTQFILIQRSDVLLRSSNGKTISRPWTRLSLADQTYIQHSLKAPANAREGQGEHKTTAMPVVQGNHAHSLTEGAVSEKRSPYQSVSQRKTSETEPEGRIITRCAYIGNFGSFHLVGVGGTAAYQLGDRKYICDLSFSKEDNAFWYYRPTNGDRFTSHWAFSRQPDCCGRYWVWRHDGGGWSRYELTKAWGDGLADRSFTQDTAVYLDTNDQRFRILERDVKEINQRLKNAGIP